MVPVIGILLGDATGIGPEIVSRLFETDELLNYCRPIIIGDRRVMEWGNRITRTAFRAKPCRNPNGWNSPWFPTPTARTKNVTALTAT